MPEVHAQPGSTYPNPYTLLDAVSSAQAATDDVNFVACSTIHTVGIAVAVVLAAGVTVSIVAEVSLDKTTWFTLGGKSLSAEAAALAITASGGYGYNASGWLFFRLRVTSISGGTVSATAAVTTGDPSRFETVSSSAATPAAPVAVSVGVASGVVITANTSRKGLVLTNTSNAYISLGLAGAAAVLYSGITLNPNGGTWEMDSATFTTGAINGIASSAAANLAVQEFT